MDKHINGFLKAHARFFDRRDMLLLLQMPLLALDRKYLYFDAVHFSSEHQPDQGNQA